MSSIGPQIRPGHDPDAEAQRLRHPLRVASRHHEAPSPHRRHRYLAEAFALFAVLCLAVWLAVEAFSPWPPLMTFRHIVSAPSCDRARVAGLVPSRRGEPGYWERHDRDGDGIACDSPIYR